MVFQGVRNEVGVELGLGGKARQQRPEWFLLYRSSQEPRRLSKVNKSVTLEIAIGSEANGKLRGQEMIGISRTRSFRLIGVLDLQLRMSGEAISEREVDAGEVRSPLRAIALSAPDRAK